MKPKLAVLQFPGTNCEYETLRALTHYGVNAKLVRWNEPLETFRDYSGFVLPGGFSFQDRVRAGAIAAKLPVLSRVQEAANAGKPVLGICNGCQILAEAGLFPDQETLSHIEVALAPNQKAQKPLGFICDWVTVQVTNPEKSVFTRYFTSEDLLPVPINHGEGRFILKEKKVASLASFRYCSAQGERLESYPTNPNGAEQNLAGLANVKGNVLAMMPHPERAAFLKQVPFWVQGPWGLKKQTLPTSTFFESGPWEKLFVSLRDSLS